MNFLFGHALWVDVFIEVLWRSIWSLSDWELIWYFIISCENEASYIFDISGSILIIVESREEAFDIPLQNGFGNQFFLAEAEDKVSELVNRDVSVGVSSEIGSDMLVKLCSVCENLL